MSDKFTHVQEKNPRKNKTFEKTSMILCKIQGYKTQKKLASGIMPLWL